MTTQLKFLIPQGALLSTATVLLTSAIATVSPQAAYACSCMRPESASVERDRSTAVFAGAVTRITPTAAIDDPDGPFFSRSPGYDVEFAVSQQWKGTLERTVRVNTANNSAACGYNFEVGEDYLVYTYGEDSNMAVGLCGRTTLLANADDDIAELDDAAPITQSESSVPAGAKPDCVEPETSIHRSRMMRLLSFWPFAQFS